MTKKIFGSVGLVLVLGGAGFASSAFAGDYPCRNQTLNKVTIDGNIVVQNGACTLNGTYVKGNVLVYSGGSLTTNGAQIDGNIQAKDAVSVAVKSNTVVDGDIQLENLRGTAPSSVTQSTVNGNIQLKSNRQSVTVLDNEVDGDIQFEGLRSTAQGFVKGNTVKGNIQLKRNYLPLSVASNDVDGDVQAFSNRANLGISSNKIDGNLQCKDNSPAPTGGGNIVSGSKEDQCRRL
ncbi:MAG: hypothetical protein MUC53_08170 [Candidatus Contendobacter sp.]|nr:hypothetical protein [Candidatus Contendobacter sp.]